MDDSCENNGGQFVPLVPEIFARGGPTIRETDTDVDLERICYGPIGRSGMPTGRGDSCKTLLGILVGCRWRPSASVCNKCQLAEICPRHTKTDGTQTMPVSTNGSSPWGTHYMYDTVCKKSYRPRGANNVCTTVKDCQFCARHRRANKKQQKLHLFPPAGLLEFVAVDISGPLPKT